MNRSLPTTQLTTTMSIGMALFFTIILGGILYFLLQIGAMFGLERNPIPGHVILMIGAMLVGTIGWLLYSVYKLVNADDEASDVDPEADRLNRLKAMYASGDIDEETFKRKVATFESDGDGGFDSDRVDNSVSDRGGDFGSGFGTTFESERHPHGDHSSTADHRHTTASEPFGNHSDDRVFTFVSSTEDKLESTETPEETLRRRFAAGEITEPEFKEALSVLRESADDQ